MPRFLASNWSRALLVSELSLHCIWVTILLPVCVDTLYGLE
jgi:hypothetical protein